MVGGLVGVQFVYAGNALLLNYLMSIGLNPLSLIVYSAFATFIVLAPLSFFFERYTIPSFFLFFSFPFYVSFLLCYMFDGMRLIDDVCSCCRSRWPSRISFKLLIQLVLISFTGYRKFCVFGYFGNNIDVFLYFYETTCGEKTKPSWTPQPLFQKYRNLFCGFPVP